MKKNIQIYTLVAICFLVFQPVILKAQPVEGTIRYLRTGNWTKMYASVDYISKQQRERLSYVWGNRSEWKTYTLLHFNMDESKYEDSEEEAEAGNEGWSNRKDVFFMKRNFKENTLYDGITMLGKTYLVHDSIVPPAWKILNDMKEVAGHICMNASLTDTIRNQRTIAWFALDMPVSAGPERFFGLPGIILEVNINEGALLMTADKITMQALTTELEVPAKIKGKKIDSPGLNKLIEKQIKERKAAEEPWFWGIRY